MRVVSMVPSWTETLIRCGVSVVGRTRFCIHRGHQVDIDIPVVGGTKDWNLEKLRSLQPDLLVFDKEENPKAMADEAPCEFIATHVTKIADVANELQRLSLKFSGKFSGAPQADDIQTDGIVDELMSLAGRWQKVCEAAESSSKTRTSGIDWAAFPGVIEWIRQPQGVKAQGEKADPAGQVLLYVIWKNPWMCVGPRTFIASMLSALGWPPERLWSGSGEFTPTNYPEFRMEEVPESAVLFFSSEPYPFHRKKEELLSLGRPCAVVDGESFSWFGVRSLEFMEKALNLPAST
jgi:hypothetical protein